MSLYFNTTVFALGKFLVTFWANIPHSESLGCLCVVRFRHGVEFYESFTAACSVDIVTDS